MSENLHSDHIDDLFKKALGDEQEKPPGHIWDALDKGLDKKTVPGNLIYDRLKRIAAVLILLAAGASLYALGILLTTKKANEAIEAKSSPISTRLPANQSSNKERYNQVENENKVAGIKTAPLRLGAGKQQKTIIPNPKKETEHINTQVSILMNKTINQPSTARLTKNGLHDKKTGIQKPAPEKWNTILPGITTNEEGGQNTAGLAVAKNLTNSPAIKDNYYREPTQKIAALSPAMNFTLPLADLKTIDFGAALSNKTIWPVKPSLFSVTVYISPELSLNTTKDGPTPDRRERDEYRKKERYASSISAGVLAEYAVTPKLSLQSGLSFWTSTIDIDSKTIYARHDNFGKVQYQYNCSSGYAYITPHTGIAPTIGDSIMALGSKNSLQYIAVPLVVKYHFSLGPLSIMPTAGLSVNFLTKGKNETLLLNNNTSKERTVNDINGLKSNYFNALAGVGVEYNLSKKIAVSLTPMARLAVTSINKNTPVNSYPNSIGLQAGFHIAL